MGKLRLKEATPHARERQKDFALGPSLFLYILLQEGHCASRAGCDGNLIESRITKEIDF